MQAVAFQRRFVLLFWPLSLRVLCQLRAIMDELKKILAPTDLSVLSLAGVRYALKR
jgi:hypothetical protein